MTVSMALVRGKRRQKGVARSTGRIVGYILAATAVAGNAQTVITIDPAVRYQTIEGWGVSLCWWANIAGGWQDSSIGDITRRAAVDLNFNVFRFNIGGGENPDCRWGRHIRKDGGDMPGYRPKQDDQKGWGIADTVNDARQIAVMDRLAGWRKGDIITECFSNSPPWWMTKSKCVAGNADGSENLDPAFADDFADYLAAVAAALKKRNPAWNIRYIEPFNEPLSTWWKAGGGQEGCRFDPDMQATVISKLRQSLHSYGLDDSKPTAPDCNSIAETRRNIYYLWKDHNAEFNAISKINAHSYFGSWREKDSLYTEAKNGGKTVWQSESGPLSWSPSDGKSWWRRHYMMAYRLIEDVRNLKCPVWCDWQFLSTDEGWGLVQLKNFDTLHPYQAPRYETTRGYYCRMQVSRFIKRGYRIIAGNDGNTIAALSPDFAEAVVVLVNQNGAPASSSIDLSKFGTINGFSTYRTSGDYGSAEHCSEKTVASKTQKGILSGGVIEYTAPEYSVTTFVVRISGTANAPAPGAEAGLFPRGKLRVRREAVTGGMIVSSGMVRDAEIAVFSLNGRLVYRRTHASGPVVIGAGHFPGAGVYLLKVKSSGETISKVYTY